MTDPTTRHVVARGNHLVLYAPPSPIAAAEVLRGVLERLVLPTEAARPSMLALAPLEAVGEWVRIAESLRDDLPVTVGGAGTPERLLRLLSSHPPILLVTAPEIALDLVHRAALKPVDQSGFLLLWPEAWGKSGEALLTELFQDVPKDTQRIVVSSEPITVGPLVERYAWRATVTDLLGQREAAIPQVRSAPVSWSSRIEAIGEVIEQLDPESVTVWVAGAPDVPSIEKALRHTGIPGRVTRETPGSAPLIIAYDLPGPAMLKDLASAGPVLLLVPPGAERYTAWLAPVRKPLHLHGALDRARDESGRLRAEILRALEKELGPSQLAALAILAPLFEHHEATAISAALFRLWQEAIKPGESGAVRGGAEGPARLWVSAGRRDGVTSRDLMAVLAGDCAVPREAIGRIEIRESFSLVEISPSAGPDQVAERVTGKSIRKRRLVARLDRSSPPLVERVAKRLPRPKDRGRA